MLTFSTTVGELFIEYKIGVGISVAVELLVFENISLGWNVTDWINVPLLRSMMGRLYIYSDMLIPVQSIGSIGVAIPATMLGVIDSVENDASVLMDNDSLLGIGDMVVEML